MNTRIKMCGMTRVEDALLAAQLGVDAIGLIFCDSSPRVVTIEQAQAIVSQLPPYVTPVAIFVDASSGYIKKVLSQVNIDLLQFHGKESPAECRSYGKPYIKAVHMTDEVDLMAYCAIYADAKGLLLETHQKGIAGGTGQIFDWELIPETIPKPIILAGGLTPDNVAAAIRQVQPYAVDVTSGIEATKGSKRS